MFSNSRCRGGMISNLVNQLREQGQEGKLPAVLLEIPRVRADLGYPPLVTPSSQICGTQAVLNVLTGERYQIVPEEVRNIVKGMYGRTPAPIAPAFRAKVLGDEAPIDGRPADLLKPEMAQAPRRTSARWPEARRMFCPTSSSRRSPGPSWPTA